MSIKKFFWGWILNPLVITFVSFNLIILFIIYVLLYLPAMSLARIDNEEVFKDAHKLWDDIGTKWRKHLEEMK